MITASYLLSGSRVKYYFEQTFKGLDNYTPREKTLIITDRNIFNLYADFFEDRRVLIVEPGEGSKTLETAARLMQQMATLGITKDQFLVGMGGGMVTDITGFIASVYMRGLSFGFIATSLLGMIDAALGGKNGVNLGLYKNMIGTIRQPRWIIFDRTLLYTLPHEEWVNGFAEIIKYGAILDAALFELLEKHSLDDFRDKHYLTSKLLYICTHRKTQLVEQDVDDKDVRRLLNFGHTIGHAIEKQQDLPHGHAVAMGMAAACRISEEINNFASADKERVLQLIRKFGLPAHIGFHKKKVLEILMLDKKRQDDTIHYVMVDAIGKGSVKGIPIKQFTDLFEQIL
jgi:3-dehydroquinate synthase